MPVWTISAQEGTGGARVAAELAAAAEVSLLDREGLALLAHELDPALPEVEDLDDLDGRFSPLAMLSLSTAVSVGSADASARSSSGRSFPRSDAPSSARRLAPRA